MNLFSPKKEIIKLLIAFLKSMIFAGGYSALVRYQVCWWTMLKNYDSSKWISNLSIIFVRSNNIGNNSDILTPRPTVLNCTFLSEQISWNQLQHGLKKKTASQNPVWLMSFDGRVYGDYLLSLFQQQRFNPIKLPKNGG